MRPSATTEGSQAETSALFEDTHSEIYLSILQTIDERGDAGPAVARLVESLDAALDRDEGAAARLRRSPSGSGSFSKFFTIWRGPPTWASRASRSPI
jgi:hypothetical protein